VTNLKKNINFPAVGLSCVQSLKLHVLSKLITYCAICSPLFLTETHTYLYFDITLRFYCPANCAGRGICKMSSFGGQCVCFDPSDNTTNCMDSKGLGFGGACYDPSSSPPLWRFSYFFTVTITMLMFIL